jgi:hypothetical protein
MKQTSSLLHDIGWGLKHSLKELQNELAVGQARVFILTVKQARVRRI